MKIHFRKHNIYLNKASVHCLQCFHLCEGALSPVLQCFHLCEGVVSPVLQCFHLCEGVVSPVLQCFHLCQGALSPVLQCFHLCQGAPSHKKHHSKVPLNSFTVNGHILEFCPVRSKRTLDHRMFHFGNQRVN